MKAQKTPPPNENDWDHLPIDIQLYIAARIFLAVDLPSILYRVDLWFFPPLAFFATYNLALRYFPPHPITTCAILATAFMAATLTLFLLRPPKRMHAHWVS